MGLAITTGSLLFFSSYFTFFSILRVGLHSLFIISIPIISECQLELEQSIHKALLELHKVAGTHGDAQLSDFIEGHYLKEQVEAEKEVGDLISKMKRVGFEGLGLHIIDKELQ